ncbi:PREDICTED: uncharacterized protein LOC104467525, partial [Pterocles gutturalis]|uniref:uncharacterized protein LOC104467525 n=1 Tax=Pterocles gutturalis TaxID=240206 RepID=UPI0005287E00
SRSSIASCTSVSTQTASDDQVVKFWDELSLVGLPDDIDVQALFEPTASGSHGFSLKPLAKCKKSEGTTGDPGDKHSVRAFLKMTLQNSQMYLCSLYSVDVHIVSTLEPLSNAVKRNVPRCTITPVLLEQAHFRISVTCPSFVQTTLIRLLKDQRKKQIVQCATALETS